MYDLKISIFSVEKYGGVIDKNVQKEKYIKLKFQIAVNFESLGPLERAT